MEPTELDVEALVEAADAIDEFARRIAELSVGQLAEISSQDWIGLITAHSDVELALAKVNREIRRGQEARAGLQD